MALAVGLFGMTMLDVDTAYFWSAIWLFIVGVGSGMFGSPNTAAMMATVPARAAWGGGRDPDVLRYTGAVISIAFVLAVSPLGRPDTLFDLLGVTSGLSARRWTRWWPTCTRRSPCSPSRR